MHQSIATIDSPEFINLQPLDINPLMSKCEIKVLYLGENRNHSYISKDVALEMAKTLRGAPIVGYYKEEKQDFADHGERVICDDEGIKFECMTKPYGFVAPDAKVWFQKFEDVDDFGNKLEREYLMTTGFLWTEQYEECKVAVEEGRPHSMELQEETLDGHWSTDNKTGMDFFIINDAIFSKLCILGDDVEPCFEGSSVTAPEVSSSFTLVNDEFKNTLYKMMQELKFALEGGSKVEEEKKDIEEVVEQTETVNTQEAVETENVESLDNTEESALTENQESIEAQSENDSFAKKEEDSNSEDKEGSEEENENKKESDTEKEEEEEEKKKDYALLEADYQALQNKFSDLENEYNKLVEFKNQIENEKKDALIASFYMLSDEDKAEVKENKAKYSLDDIEAKLSVICVRKKVNFDLDNTSKNDVEVEEEKPITTFNLDNGEDSAPAWISALRKTHNNRK